MKKLFLFVVVFICLQFNVLAQWTTKAPMPTARGFLSTSVVNGKIYAIGGAFGPFTGSSAVEEYDPVNNTWIQKNNMPETRSDFSTCVIDGKIYAIGGSESLYGALRSSILVYDPMTDIWVEKTQMLTPRVDLSANVVDGKIYVIGGASEGISTALSIVEVYDPATDTWAPKADMPTARCSHCTSVVDGKIYVIGGTIGSPWNGLSVVEVYDPATDTWEQKTDMPTARWGFGTAEVNAKIYAIGGASPGASGVFNTVEVYDPVTDTWAQKTDMPTARRVFSANVLDGKVYTIGGVAGPQGSAYVLATVEAYTPPPTSNIDPGNVSGTWTKNGSPYYVNGEITIPNDSTLTIEPGVKVVFTGHYKFNVRGRLLAIGTETDTILFTISDTTGFHHLTLPDGGWHGIKIYDVAISNDSTIFEYCTFEYGKSNTGSGIVNRSGGAIYSTIDKLRVSNCLFRYNKSYSTDTWEGTSGAILVFGNPIIEYCEFCWNESSWGSAMCVAGNTTGAIIRNNHFHHNTGHGTINICVDAYPTFINNLIEYNHSYGEPSTPHGHGILHFSNNTNNNTGNAKIINNTIVNNTNVGEGGGVFVRDGNPTFINNIIYGNQPSQVNFLWASSVGFYNNLIEGGRDGFTGASFTGAYENCIDADPLFVSSNDYHLQNTSPCIGAGIDSILIGSHWYYCPSNCFYGGIRPNPVGSMPDIGACENPYANPVGVEEYLSVNPTEYALHQNYPNPFNPTTTIKYSIPKLSFVTIKIYNVLGSEVATLVNEEKPIGTYELSWNAANLSSGVYFYRLQAGSFVQTRKMILAK